MVTTLPKAINATSASCLTLIWIARIRLHGGYMKDLKQKPDLVSLANCLI